MKTFLNIILWIPKTIGLALVWLYRILISPFIPHACKYDPTCSVYMTEAITEFGIIKGGMLGLKRLAKCNPWSKGGKDPVPVNSKGDYIWLM